MPKNVSVETLVFKDESVYTGQVHGEDEKKVPHGYGRMRTKGGFEVTGYFINGKNIGPGIFKAPNGDTFYGKWNDDFKREGYHMKVTPSGKLQLHSFQDGKLKRVIAPRKPSGSKTHWLTPNITRGHIRESDEEALSVTGHTLCKVDGHIILFGGERKDKSSGLLKASNALYMYDKGSKQWHNLKCKGDIPPPSQGHTATAVGEKMVVIGGRDGVLQHSCVHALDMRTGNWTCVVSKGIPLAGHTSTAIGEKIFCILSGNVFILDTSRWTWTKSEVDTKEVFRARIPHAVMSHSAIAVGAAIYVFGGIIMQKNPNSRGGKNFQRCSNHLIVLDTLAMKWRVPPVTGPEPEKKASKHYSGIPEDSWRLPRADHAAALVGEEMIIVGGHTTCNPNLNVIDSSYLGDVQILNVNTLEWRSPPITRSYSQPSACHCVLPVDNDIWLTGGHNHSSDTIPQFGILHIGPDLHVKKGPSKTKVSAPGKPRDQPKPRSEKEPSAASIDTEPQKENTLFQKRGSVRQRKEWGKPVQLNFGGDSEPPKQIRTPSATQKPAPQPVTSSVSAPSDEKSGSALSDVKEWDEEQVQTWLVSVAVRYKLKSKTIAALAEEDVDGSALLMLTEADMRSIGVSLGQSKALISAVATLKT
ncbi:hypothetical protein AAMO2058_001610200 [Amorphochlora amoebiformis]|mmetsp:Transcript_11105/g.17554  ORF Transcript_11105/g.17554 Transcript_11105/m.17554 type:complete len:642 (-) Transcript_11105:106-2031(-)